MEFDAREHVPALTGVLSVVSLSLVFAAALRVIPPGVLPQADGLIAVIPHVNAALSATAIVTIATGVSFIRSGAVRKHQAMMVTSFVLFAIFLVLYVYRVAVVGPTPFPETASSTVETGYYVLLAVHILLAIVCVPLLYYVLLLAVTRPVHALYETNHRRVGRVAAALWTVSFALGIVVYALLYAVY